MKSHYTAAIRRDGPWWIGWVLEMNGADALAAIHDEYKEVDLQV
jgi:hypothetical protein